MGKDGQGGLHGGVGAAGSAGRGVHMQTGAVAIARWHAGRGADGVWRYAAGWLLFGRSVQAGLSVRQGTGRNVDGAGRAGHDMAVAVSVCARRGLRRGDNVGRAVQRADGHGCAQVRAGKLVVDNGAVGAGGSAGRGAGAASAVGRVQADGDAGRGAAGRGGLGRMHDAVCGESAAPTFGR